MCYLKNLDRSKYEPVLVKVLEPYQVHNELLQDLEINLDITVISENDFNALDFDLVLPMSDKLVPLWLNKCYPHAINLNDKLILQQCTDSFNFFGSLTKNIADDDFVIIKPRISSGCHSEHQYAYRPILSKNVQHYYDNEVTQKFIDSSEILLVHFISNGQKLILTDTFMQNYVYNPEISKFPIMACLIDVRFRREFDTAISALSNFLKHFGYCDIKNVICCQLIIKDGQYFLIDVNLRTGPVTVAAEIRNMVRCKQYYSIPFLMGDTDGSELDRNLDNATICCYAETLDNKKISNFEYAKNENDILIKSDKTTGVVRKDLNVYIQRVNLGKTEL